MAKLNLYLCVSGANRGFDYFDSFVIACGTSEEAKNTGPLGDKINTSEPMINTPWTNNPLDVTVTELGRAANNVEKGVICASFNAEV